MKTQILLFTLVSFTFAASAQSDPIRKGTSPSAKDTLTVEAACGQCKLGLPGESCDLAIRLNGQACFVEGTGIDAHGDAHAKDGFCNAIRKARVTGTVANNRFKVTYFQLLPQPKTPAPKLRND